MYISEALARFALSRKSYGNISKTLIQKLNSILCYCKDIKYELWW